MRGWVSGAWLYLKFCTKKYHIFQKSGSYLYELIIENDIHVLVLENCVFLKIIKFWNELPKIIKFEFSLQQNQILSLQRNSLDHLKDQSTNVNECSTLWENAYWGCLIVRLIGCFALFNNSSGRSSENYRSVDVFKVSHTCLGNSARWSFCVMWLHQDMLHLLPWM